MAEGKGHRKKKAGRKAEKRKNAEKKKKGEVDEQVRRAGKERAGT